MRDKSGVGTPARCGLGSGRGSAAAMFVNTGDIDSATSPTSPPDIDDDAFLLLIATEHAWVILYISCAPWTTSRWRQPTRMRCVLVVVYLSSLLTTCAIQGFSKPSGIKQPSGLKAPTQLPKFASQGRPLGELQDASTNSRSALPAPSNKHKPSGCKLPIIAYQSERITNTRSARTTKQGPPKDTRRESSRIRS